MLTGLLLFLCIWVVCQSIARGIENDQRNKMMQDVYNSPEYQEALKQKEREDNLPHIF